MVLRFSLGRPIPNRHKAPALQVNEASVVSPGMDEGRQKGEPRRPEASRLVTSRQRHPLPPELMPRQEEAQLRGSTARRALWPRAGVGAISSKNLSRFNEAPANSLGMARVAIAQDKFPERCTVPGRGAGVRPPGDWRAAAGRDRLPAGRGVGRVMAIPVDGLSAFGPASVLHRVSASRPGGHLTSPRPGMAGRREAPEGSPVARTPWFGSRLCAGAFVAPRATSSPAPCGRCWRSPCRARLRAAARFNEAPANSPGKARRATRRGTAPPGSSR